jgi:hypothetical protein
MGLTRLRAEQISDIDYKQAVRVITTTDITLSGGAPNQVDGVNVTIGDRILVNGQSTGSQNGIYQVQTAGTGSSGTWIRSLDTNATGELEAGTIVMVTEGNTYADTQWKLTTNNPIIIGTTALTFEQNSAYAFGNIYANGTAVLANSVGSTVTFTAGNNIVITGNNTSKTVTIGVTGLSLNSISNGTSNVNVVGSGGNVTVGVGGTSNVAVFSSGGANVTGTLGVSGNLTTASAVNFNLPNSSSTDVTISSGLATAFKTRIGTTATNQYSWRTNLYYTGAAWQKDDNTRGAWRLNQVCLTGNANSVMQFTYAPIGSTDVNELMTLTGEGLLTVTGNITGGNLLTGGLISAAGNITASTYFGAGTGLTGTAASLTVGLATTATTAGTVTTEAQPNITSVGTLSSVSVTGNVQGGNIRTAGLITVTGNITGGNIITAGLFSATGNVTGNYFIGNGSQLTGLASGGNVQVLTRSSGVINISIISGDLVVLGRSGNINIPVIA